MKHSLFGFRSIRVALAGLLAVVLAACGGNSTTPVTALPVQEVRPLSPEFTSRQAVGYSPYRTAADRTGLDAEVIPPANIKQDLDLLMAAGFRMIRLFTSSDAVARQTLQVIAQNNMNMRVQLGAFIAGDVFGTPVQIAANLAANDAEIARLIALANDPVFKDIIVAVAVGNETQVDFAGVRTKPETLIGYLRRVRSQVSQPVTTEDNHGFWASGDAAAIADEVDFVAVHIYPGLDTVFSPRLWDWRQQGVLDETQRAAAMMDAAFAETRKQYQAVRDALDRRGQPHLPITVGETGWNAVNLGRQAFRAHPVNHKIYFDHMMAWAAEGRAGAGPKAVIFFVAFDEPWKLGDDGWGLFNKDRQARYAIQALNANNSPAGSATWVWEPGSYTAADAVYFKPAVVGTAITSDRYTLYAEAAAPGTEFRPAGLRWDAFDGNTALAPEVTSDFGPGDATRSIEITPVPKDFGWGLVRQSPTGATDNLSNFAATGSLNFSIRTTYPGKIEIGIGTDTQDRDGQEAYVQLEPGKYGYCNTGAWCSVSIPLRDFLAVNPRLDLSLVQTRFIIADRYAQTGKPANANIRTRLSIDSIYWSK